MSNASCWKCHQPIESERASSLFCSSCNALQPVGVADHFKRLGLKRATFNVGINELEKNYIMLQNQLHPDRFIRADDKEKTYAMSHTMAVNEAYETLKNPLMRAQYMLEQRGVIVNQTGQDIKPSQQLLMETLESRDDLENASDVTHVKQMASRTTDQHMACIESLSQLLDSDDNEQAAQQVMRLKFLEKFLEEIRIKLHQLTSQTTVN